MGNPLPKSISSGSSKTNVLGGMFCSKAARYRNVLKMNEILAEKYFCLHAGRYGNNPGSSVCVSYLNPVLF